MSRIHVFVSAAVVLSAFTLAGCGEGSSMRQNPNGPSSMTSPMSQMGPGGMGGAGMAAAVASEFDYLAGMIPHHEEAIATARILQRGTERQEMRAFAAAIIETQSAEVDQMKSWLAAWYPGRDIRVVYQPMMRDLVGLTGNALDRAFLNDMIPHHMVAVMMSQQFVMRNLAEHADVVPFAGNIRDTQHAEIQMMSAWLRAWFGA